MSGANRLISSMAGLGKNSVSEVLFGRVTSVEPLIIVRDGSENESRAPLSAEFLVLSKMCKEFRIKSGIHRHTVAGENISVQNAGSHEHVIPANTAAANGEHTHSTSAGATGAAGNHNHTVPASAAQSAGEHSHAVADVNTSDGLGEMLIWPGLKLGERVILISFNNNQRYFVERLEKLENEV